MADGKTCRYCFTEIDARASVCPNCRQRLSGRVWWIALPIGLFAVLFATVGWMESWLGKKLETPGEDFAKHSGELRICDAELRFGQDGHPDRPREVVAVVGKLENDGDLPWENIVLAVAFFNKDNRMVDAIQDYGQLSIAPRGTTPFKVSGGRQFPKDHYVSYKVQVAVARHARWPF